MKRINIGEIRFNELLQILDLENRNKDTLQIDQTDTIYEAYKYIEYYFQRNQAPDRLDHSMKVAIKLANWDFGYEIVIAGMLHEVIIYDLDLWIQIRNNYSIKTQNVLENYKKLKHELEKIETNYIKDESKVVRFLNVEEEPAAFYLLIAERIDDLENAYATKDFATMTEKLLIPQVEKINAYSIVDVLQEKCFYLSNENLYSQIEELRSIVNRYNQKSRKEFIDQLRTCFTRTNVEGLKDIQSLVVGFYDGPRSIASLSRFIKSHSTSSTNTLEERLSILKDKYQTAYDELTLVVKDELVTETGVSYQKNTLFMEFFKKVLMDEHVVILDYNMTRHQRSHYFEIADRYNNRYRLFIRKETEWNKYRLGDIIDPELMNKINVNSKMITVYLDGVKPIDIEEDATVLDLAFLVGKNYGFHFDYALINQSDAHYTAKTLLRDQDSIIIKTNDIINPHLNWFRYIKTEKARVDLIQYFAKDYGFNDVQVIDNRTKDAISIEGNSLPLDIAFVVDGKKALYFSKLIMNGKEYDKDSNIDLEENSYITIEYSDTIQATFEWFKFIRTNYARDLLIDYFEKTYKE